MNESTPDYTNLMAAIAAVDIKVDKLAESVQGVVHAFDALSGAFAVLETIGKIAKPVLWISGVFTGIALAYHWLVDHVKIWVSAVR
jgi:hypothetical protein